MGYLKWHRSANCHFLSYYCYYYHAIHIAHSCWCLLNSYTEVDFVSWLATWTGWPSRSFESLSSASNSLLALALSRAEAIIIIIFQRQRCSSVLHWHTKPISRYIMDVDRAAAVTVRRHDAACRSAVHLATMSRSNWPSIESASSLTDLFRFSCSRRSWCSRRARPHFHTSAADGICARFTASRSGSSRRRQIANLSPSSLYNRNILSTVDLAAAVARRPNVRKHISAANAACA